MTGARPPVHVRAMLAVENSTALDGAASALSPVADAVVASPTRRRLLQDRIMGHALHPVLTDVPLGSWLSATVLDLSGGPGSRPAATRLLGFGVLSALPTAVAGLAEWAMTDGGPRRVGVVHATSNTLALGLYTGSWLARRRQRHPVGVALSLMAGTAALAGGFLGSHLSLARKVSTHDPAFTEDATAGR